VFAADKKLIHSFGGIETSPTFVFLDEQGQVLAKQQGYLPPEKLFNAVSILSNAQCSLAS
jgi:thioredoxin-related protein